MILDIPANLFVTDEIIQIFIKLKSLGFTLALEKCEPRKELNPILKYVDILKIDVSTI